MKTISTLIFVFLFEFINAQTLHKPPKDVIKNAPEWAKMMYAEGANYYKVKHAFKAYYKEHLFEKNIHTRYFKFWQRAIIPFLNENGVVQTERHKVTTTEKMKSLMKSSGNWSLVGPLQTYAHDGRKSSDQLCVTSIDQFDGDSSILYCGTQGGEVFRTNDQGNTWFNVSMSLSAPNYTAPYWMEVNTLAIHPSNADVVYCVIDQQVFKTIDGGNSWSTIYTSNAGAGGYKLKK